ncbi:MAG: zinc metallopeptidase [Chloroflexota bacterium]|jgi:Zn-dependent membrane protease YugP|nr:zinc metallopeptidase [Anaerolineae bacterium]HMM29665.1 zinc metallopeptidase [Aggregatilineaceae bacterium]
MFFDPNYILFVMLPTLIISGLAQAAVRGAYQKWGNIRNSQGVNGQQTAQLLIRSGNVQPVGLEVTGGQLTDHYDPGKGVVRMSQGVAMQPSVASMAVAAHELGHVQQHQQSSALMSLRSMLVPSAQFGPSIGILLIILGLMFNATGLATIGLVLFAGAALFTIVTLPVELDASRRAMKMLEQTGLLATEQDRDGAKAVLRAAAFTYVAAVATSILTLLYYAMLVFGGRNRD